MAKNQMNKTEKIKWGIAFGLILIIIATIIGLSLEFTGTLEKFAQEETVVEETVYVPKAGDMWNQIFFNYTSEIDIEALIEGVEGEAGDYRQIVYHILSGVRPDGTEVDVISVTENKTSLGATYYDVLYKGSWVYSTLSGWNVNSIYNYSNGDMIESLAYFTTVENAEEVAKYFTFEYIAQA